MLVLRLVRCGFAVIAMVGEGYRSWGAWGAAAGIAYLSFFQKLLEPASQNAGNLPRACGKDVG